MQYAEPGRNTKRPNMRKPYKPTLLARPLRAGNPIKFTIKGHNRWQALGSHGFVKSF